MVLKNKRVAITGAFGTLGTAVVGRALAEGALVAALDHAAAPKSPSEFGDAVLIGGVDLAEAQGAKSALAQAAEALGGLDALVNIAGGFAWEKIEGSSLDTWDRMFRMNLLTAVAASQAALPWVLKSPSGRIVNIGAAAAMKAELGKDTRDFALPTVPDDRAVFRYDMHTLPSEIGDRIGMSTTFAAWHADIYVNQIEDERLDSVTADGSYLQATRDVLQKYGGLWFNDEAFTVTRHAA